LFPLGGDAREERQTRRRVYTTLPTADHSTINHPRICMTPGWRLSLR